MINPEGYPRRQPNPLREQGAVGGGSVPTTFLKFALAFLSNGKNPTDFTVQGAGSRRQTCARDATGCLSRLRTLRYRLPRKGEQAALAAPGMNRKNDLMTNDLALPASMTIWASRL